MSANRDSFVAAMRQLASSVTVVVTTDGLAEPAGAAVSAFTSLSAAPPSVLICLKSDRRISKTAVENEVFCVNVLPEDAIQTAQLFAGLFDQTQNNRFEKVELLPAPSGAILSGATSFVCVFTPQSVSTVITDTDKGIGTLVLNCVLRNFKTRIKI